MSEVDDVYNGSDGERTKALYARLADMTPRGPIAMNLLRTLKASSRAKVYRGKPGRGGPSYRSLAYEKKDWSIGELCRVLRDHAEVCGITWGWGFDAKAIGFEHVLYVDLPGAGQVSFHTHHRRDGLDYPGEWDGMKDVSRDRVCAWAQAVLDGRDCQLKGERDVARQDRPEGEGADGSAGAEVRGEPEGEQTNLDV